MQLSIIMGNQNYGGVQIILDKPTYQQGETVVGTVGLKVSKAFYSGSLCMTVEGEQTCRFMDHSRRWNQLTKSLFKFKPLVLAKFEDSLVRTGEYQYPFMFRLPRGLPSSVREVANNFQIWIAYSLRVFFDKGQKAEIKPVLKEINLFEKRKCEVKKQSLREVVNVRGCFDRGYCIVSMQPGKEELHPGEQLQIQVGIDNRQCTVALAQLQLKLFKLVVVVEQDRELVKIIKLVNTVTSASEAEAGSLKSHVLQLRLFNQRQNCQLQPTCTGRMIRIRYILELSYRHSGLCNNNATFPFLFKEVQVLPQVAVPVPTAPPPGWNPVRSAILKPKEQGGESATEAQFNYPDIEA